MLKMMSEDDVSPRISSRQRWMESSDAEIKLSRQIALVLYNKTRNETDLCQILESIASLLAESAHGYSASLENKALVDLIYNFPELRKINLQKPFPESALDLTANFFGRLAYEMGCLLRDPILRGVFATPPILAWEMVSLSIQQWLIEHNHAPSSLEGILGEGAIHISDKIFKEIHQIRWYDPCVGGGVFPITILLVLNRLGFQIGSELLANIQGADLDPLAVTATRIRVSFVVANLNKQTYLEVRSILPIQIDVKDSLSYFQERPAGIIDKDCKKFDVVIGNPPYVRADRLGHMLKVSLAQAYPSIAGGSVDLYNYFIAHGLNALNSKGILCYISPASFQRSKYGRATRDFINQNSAVRVVLDFNELPVFEGASVHSSVYVLAKAGIWRDVSGFVFDNLPTHTPIAYALRHAKKVDSQNIRFSSWNVTQSETSSVLACIENSRKTLAEYVGGLVSGIKAGHKQAFYVSQIEADQLNLDSVSASFIKPLLRPIGIRTWQTTWDGTHIALVKKGQILSEESSLFSRMKGFEQELRTRSDVQGHPTWYGLRECSYYDIFTQPKIVFPDIASECRFALDRKGFFIPDGAFIIPVDDEVLLGMLNSCIGRFYFRAKCNSIGNPYNGGRLRFKKAYVSEFPIPEKLVYDLKIREEITYLVNSLIQNPNETSILYALDNFALDIYEVSNSFRDLVLEAA
jgi:hypothetical protein